VTGPDAGTYAEPELKPEILRKLQESAAHGATVRELVRIVQDRLALPEDAVVPVLAYFSKAFSLSLREVLPIREWLGTNNDKEIDSIILPAIERAKGWSKGS
jgi:hypothetical protein